MMGQGAHSSSRASERCSEPEPARWWVMPRNGKKASSLVEIATEKRGARVGVAARQLKWPADRFGRQTSWSCGAGQAAHQRANGKSAARERLQLDSTSDEPCQKWQFESASRAAIRARTTSNSLMVTSISLKRCRRALSTRSKLVPVPCSNAKRARRELSSAISRA